MKKFFALMKVMCKHTENSTLALKGNNAIYITCEYLSKINFFFQV